MCLPSGEPHPCSGQPPQVHWILDSRASQEATRAGSLHEWLLIHLTCWMLLVSSYQQLVALVITGIQEGSHRYCSVQNWTKSSQKNFKFRETGLNHSDYQWLLLENVICNSLTQNSFSTLQATYTSLINHSTWTQSEGGHLRGLLRVFFLTRPMPVSRPAAKQRNTMWS